MDRLEAMTVFLHAVDGGSLSAAGRKLGMPLATVSRKLSDLETHLKARLLNRSTRQLTLTDAGREYLAACKRILESHVLPVIADFLKVYPEVDVRLVQGDRFLNLLEEHVDVAVRVGTLPDSRLTATRLGATRRVVCASPQYFSEHGMPQSPRELMTRVLSYQLHDALRAGTLVLALREYEPAPLPVSLAYAGQRRSPLKLRAFLDYVAPRLRERLQASDSQRRTVGWVGPINPASPPHATLG